MVDINFDKEGNVIFDLDTPQVDLVNDVETPTFIVDIGRTAFEVISKFCSPAYTGPNEITIEKCKVVFTLANDEDETTD